MLDFLIPSAGDDGLVIAFKIMMIIVTLCGISIVFEIIFRISKNNYVSDYQRLSEIYNAEVKLLKKKYNIK